MSAKAGRGDSATDQEIFQLPQLVESSRLVRKVSVRSKIPTPSAPRYSIALNELVPDKVEVFRSVSKNLRTKIVKSDVTKGPPLGKRALTKFDDKFRERVYTSNSQLKLEENERFAIFKQERLNMGPNLCDELDYDSDSGSVFETPKWILGQCQYYSASGDNERRRRNSKKLKKPESVCNRVAVSRSKSLSGDVSGAV